MDSHVKLLFVSQWHSQTRQQQDHLYRQMWTSFGLFSGHRRYNQDVLCNNACDHIVHRDVKSRSKLLLILCLSSLSVFFRSLIPFSFLLFSSFSCKCSLMSPSCSGPIIFLFFLWSSLLPGCGVEVNTEVFAGRKNRDSKSVSHCDLRCSAAAAAVCHSGVWGGVSFSNMTMKRFLSGAHYQTSAHCCRCILNVWQALRNGCAPKADIEFLCQTY